MSFSESINSNKTLVLVTITLSFLALFYISFFPSDLILLEYDENDDKQGNKPFHKQYGQIILMIILSVISFGLFFSYELYKKTEVVPEVVAEVITEVAYINN
jgi:hypothetical protein